MAAEAGCCQKGAKSITFKVECNKKSIWTRDTGFASRWSLRTLRIDRGYFLAPLAGCEELLRFANRWSSRTRPPATFLHPLRGARHYSDTRPIIPKPTDYSDILHGLASCSNQETFVRQILKPCMVDGGSLSRARIRDTSKDKSKGRSLSSESRAIG